MSAEDLTAEASQYAWGGAIASNPEPVRQRDPRLHPDHRPTSVQLRDSQAELTTARTQRDLAQADADRHLRNARYLGGLLEQIAGTLGANPLDFAELPALVDGCRTAHDQASIRASDLVHAVDRVGAASTISKTRLVHESQRLRDHLDKARLATARAEARAGAYCLAYDHLDAVTRKLVEAIRQHINREPLGVHHLLTQADRDRLLDATDTVHDALSRDMESYLAEPYDDITLDTRVDITPAGLAVASVPRVARVSVELPPEDRDAVTLGAIVIGSEIVAEAVRPGASWGEQDRPDGTTKLLAGMADDARRDREHAATRDRVTWLDLAAEAFWSAMTRQDPRELRAALVELGAAVTAWASAIDRRDTGDDDEDLMTPGMPNPCQPIGCDNGYHLPGCAYAETDAEPR